MSFYIEPVLPNFDDNECSLDEKKDTIFLISHYFCNVCKKYMRKDTKRKHNKTKTHIQNYQNSKVKK